MDKKKLDNIQKTAGDAAAGTAADGDANASRMADRPTRTRPRISPTRPRTPTTRNSSSTRATMSGNCCRWWRRRLSRIREGSFGECIHCGKEINAKRLEAVPWTRHCIECQEKLEQGCWKKPPNKAAFRQSEMGRPGCWRLFCFRGRLARRKDHKVTASVSKDASKTLSSDF